MLCVTVLLWLADWEALCSDLEFVFSFCMVRGCMSVEIDTCAHVHECEQVNFRKSMYRTLSFSHIKQLILEKQSTSNQVHSRISSDKSKHYVLWSCNPLKDVVVIWCVVWMGLIFTFVVLKCCTHFCNNSNAIIRSLLHAQNMLLLLSNKSSVCRHFFPFLG